MPVPRKPVDLAASRKVQSETTVPISCRAAAARWSAGRCNPTSEKNDKPRRKHRHCNELPAPAQQSGRRPSPRHRRLPEPWDLQARRDWVERSAHRYSRLELPAMIVLRLVTRRRGGPPGCQPSETSASIPSPGPAARCQEQSPGRHRRPQAASLGPPRHNTTGGISRTNRFVPLQAPVVRANAAIPESAPGMQ